jgi:tetratricopeptide (TPR) repeat protein
VRSLQHTADLPNPFHGALLDGRLQWPLTRLFDTVARLCREIGCHCLAERFSCNSTACCASAQGCSNAAAQQRPMIHLMAKLAPLTRVLLEAGYYDIALATVQIALALEPTLDLALARAYLHVVLGDMADASRIYRDVLQRIGTIPQDELQRLAELSRTHAQEEDIAELVDQLRAYATA